MSYVLGIAVVRLVEGRFFLFEHPFGDEFSEAAAAGRGEEIPGGGARGRFRRAGLIKAINAYEPNKVTQLATYTAKCIENEILMLLRANKKFKNNVSLSEVVGTDKDGNELMLIDLLCEKDDSVFQKVEKAIQNEKFTELVRAVLTEREFKIITLRTEGRQMPPAARGGLADADLPLIRLADRKKSGRKIEGCREKRGFLPLIFSSSVV